MLQGCSKKSGFLSSSCRIFVHLDDPFNKTYRLALQSQSNGSWTLKGYSFPWK